MKKLSIFLVLFILAAGFAFTQEEEQPQQTAQQEPQPQAQQTQQAQQAQQQPQQEEAEETEKKRAIEIFNFEIGIGFPVHWTNGRHDGEFYQVNVATPSYTMEDKLVTANTAFSLATVFNFTRVFGLAIEMDFFYGTKLGGFSNPSSDHNSLFGINAFLGPLFYIFNNNVLRIPLSFGAHMYYFADDLWVSEYASGDGAWFNRKDLQFGPAIALGVQFHFNSGIYLFTKTQLAIDFIRIHKIQTDNLTDQAISLRDHQDIIINSINWGIRPSFGIGIRSK